MATIWILFLIGLLQSQALGFVNHFSRRQTLNQTTPNAFASIEASDDLSWTPCYSDSAAAALGRVECARLNAPKVYTDPSKGTVQLAIIRLVAANGKTGNQTPLFLNNGGPGADSTDFLRDFAPLVWGLVGAGTDLIAVAPRAVGDTLPAMSCYLNPLLRQLRTIEFVRDIPGYTKKSLGAADATAEGFAVDCNLVSPQVLPYVGTVATAKDINFVSEKLGQNSIRFLGLSYGSVLGATFAQLYPDKVERMLLDGIVDVNDYYSAQRDPKKALVDTDKVLANFFRGCYEAGPEKCAIWRKGGPSAVKDAFLEADRKIFEKPLNVPQIGLLLFSEWRALVYNQLYTPNTSFQGIAEAVAEILNGTAGTVVQAAAAALLVPRTTAETSLADARGLSNGEEGGVVIQCTDREPRTVVASQEQVGRIFESYRQVSEIGSVDAINSIICNKLLAVAEERPKLPFANIQTTGPILFVSNTADPITPRANGVAAVRYFPGSRLLTINGTGHTSSNAARDNRCAVQWFAPYFANGTLPPIGTVCDGAQQPFG